MNRPLSAALGSVVLVLASAALMPGQEPKGEPALPGGKTAVKVVTKPVPAAKVEMMKEDRAAPAPAFRPAEALKAAVRLIAPGQAAPAPDLDPMIREIMTQLRPLLRSEVHFIQTVCELDAEQTARIGRAGEGPLREAARRLAEVQHGVVPARNDSLDYQQVFGERMVEVVAAELSAEQAERYREAAAARATFRKEAAIKGLVACVDQEVSLSPDQRQQLTDALASHWNPSWSHSLEWLQHGTQFLPDLPDQVLDSVLNDTQMLIWRSKPRGQTIIGFSRGSNLTLERPTWEEDPAPQQGVGINARGMIIRVAPPPAPPARNR